MSRLGLMFPGQGSQAIGMGAALRQRSAAARVIFDLADRVTDLPITRLCDEGPLDRLTATEVAQPAIAATSLAALAVLRETAGDALHLQAVAGHSVGEIAAYVAAGVLAEDEALRLVAVRARAMAQACALVDGSMAVVLGLDDALVEVACRDASTANERVELANLNAPGQVVISGHRAALERAGARARELGARRVMPINVGGPFHSSYMRPAVPALDEVLSSVTFHDACVPVVANVTAREVRTADELRSELRSQVCSTVRWAESVTRLSELGCTHLLEVGPGQVLAGLARRMLSAVEVASFGDPAELDHVLRLVSSAT